MSLAPAPFPFIGSDDDYEGGTFVVHGDSIWLFGGIRDDEEYDYEMTDQVYKYDVAYRTWSEETPLSIEFVGFGIGGVSHDGWLYFTGFTDDEDWDNSFIRYNPDTGVTELLSTPSEDFGGNGLITVPGSENIYMALGSPDARRYHVPTATWHDDVSSNPAFYSPDSGLNELYAVYDGEIVCSHLPNNFDFPVTPFPESTSMAVYNLAENTWRLLPELPVPALGSTVFVLHGRLYAVGGRDSKTDDVTPIFTVDKTLYRLLGDESGWEVIEGKDMPASVPGLSFLDDAPWPPNYIYGVVDNKLILILSWFFRPENVELGTLAFVD